MHFFITGATGYIGSVCAEKAIAEGHTVHALSRTAAGDAKLEALGAVPIRGDLSTFDTLTRESARADVVLHCAFTHDFAHGKFEDLVRLDSAAIDALAEGLKGSGKRLVVSSAAAGRLPEVDGGETDETSPVDESFPMKARVLAEGHMIKKRNDGVRLSILRIAPFVYGRGGSTFVPGLIDKAHSAGVSLYVGDGSQRVTSVHVDDAATLYLTAAKHPTDGIFHVSGSTTITTKELAEAVGTLLQVPARSLSKEEAVEDKNLGPIYTMVMGTESRSSGMKAREELGWKPTGVDMLTDIVHGSYVEYAAKLARNA